MYLIEFQSNKQNYILYAFYLSSEYFLSEPDKKGTHKMISFGV